MMKRFAFPRREEETPKEPGSQFREQLAQIQRKIDRAYHRQTPEEILREMKIFGAKHWRRLLQVLLEKAPASPEEESVPTVK